MTLFRNNNGKVAGFLKNRIYYKEVVKSKHFFRMYQSYGISKDIVNQLIGICDTIRLKEIDTGCIYQVEFKDFLDKGFEKKWDDTQIFLPIKYWILDEEATMKLF